jgi:hypothetical protein
MATERARDWTCRFFQDGDEEGMLDVLLTTFKRWPTAEITVPPIEHLRWKLRSDDRALRAHTVVESADRIVGCSISISQRVKLGDRVLRAVHSVDAAVLPEYQALGVGRDFRRFQATSRPRLFDLYFGLQSGHPAMPSLRKQDWTGVRLTNPGEVLVAGAPVVSASEADGWKLREVAQFDDRIDAFRQEAAAPFDRITMRSKDELNWRYCDPRSGPYRSVLAEDGGRIAGQVTYRTSRGRGYIADLLALPGRLDVLASLVRHVLAAMGAEGVAEVECWSTPRHPYRDVLRDAGFDRLRKETTIVHKAMRGLDDELACLQDERAVLHVMAGDTDLV